MISTYLGLVQYFEGITADVTTLKGVTVGNDEAIEGLLNSSMKYPHLWVETPAVRFTGMDDNPATRYSFSIVVIKNEPGKTNTLANTALSDTLTILEALWAQLMADADAEKFDLVHDETDGEPIRQWSGDNAYGWRMTIHIEIPRSQC